MFDETENSLIKFQLMGLKLGSKIKGMHNVLLYTKVWWWLSGKDSEHLKGAESQATFLRQPHSFLEIRGI